MSDAVVLIPMKVFVTATDTLDGMHLNPTAVNFPVAVTSVILRPLPRRLHASPLLRVCNNCIKQTARAHQHVRSPNYRSLH